MRRLLVGSVGVVLLVMLAAWNLLSAPDAPESTSGFGACLLLAAGLVLGAASARIDPAIPGVSVLVAAVAAFVWTRPESLEGGPLAPPLGYANANGALLVAAAGGAAVAARQRGLPSRLAASLACCGLAALCWTVDAQAAAVASALLAAWVVVARLGPAAPWTALGAVLLLIPAALPVGWGAGWALPASVERRLTSERVDLWSDAVDMIRQHPWRGVGAGRFSAESPTAADRDLAWAHSYVLQAGAELGLVGLGLVVMVVVWAVIALGRDAVLAAALLLPATVDYVLHFGWVLFVVGVVAGASVMTSRTHRSGAGLGSAEGS